MYLIYTVEIKDNYSSKSYLHSYLFPLLPCSALQLGHTIPAVCFSCSHAECLLFCQWAVDCLPFHFLCPYSNTTTNFIIFRCNFLQ